VAQHEADREDLLRAATALVERVELRLAGETPAFVGFRTDGCASFYLAAEPAYHFNTAGELRRAYVDGQLYKAERGALSRLSRQRDADAVQLIRHDLTPEQTQTFLAQVAADLQGLSAALRDEHFRIVGQVPKNADVVGRVMRWLAEHTTKPIGVANSPHAR
jgi:hypothetical protein